MKSNFFKEIIDESKITIDLEYDKTLSRLQQMQGHCRETDSADYDFYFFCKKNGKFYISTSYSGKRGNDSLYIKGSVKPYEEDNSIIEFFILKDKSYFFFSVFSLIFDVLLICYLIFLFVITKTYFNLKHILFVVFAVFITGVSFSNSLKKKKNISVDAAILKNEVLKRVEAVIDWDK